MPLPSTVELVCSFSTIKTEPLSPFVWLLLKALNTFPAGERPEFDQLAEKLAFRDSNYLSEAWSDTTKYRLCERGDGQPEEPSPRALLFERERIDFNYAKISDSGVAALNDGFIQKEPPRVRKGEVLYFALRDGSPITDWKDHYESKEIGSLHRPNWADKITEKTIKETLKFQRESNDEHIQPDEQIFDLVIHWEECRRVKLD